jgi:cytochrome c oxidase subunit 2
MFSSLLTNPILADKNASFFFPEAASSFAPEVDFLFWAITWISIFFFVIIVAVMVLFVWKYRERPGYKGSPEALHNTPLEIAWTVFPTLIVIWIFARGTVGYLDMSTIPETDAFKVNVTAQQWAWTFEYPNGAISTELHLPVDRPSKMVMQSKDVIHSLYVPSFRAKCDIVPGRVNYMWFQPTMLTPKAPADEYNAAMEEIAAVRKKASNDALPFGWEKAGFTEEGYTYFDLFCTEYCGDKHSQMGAPVVVHTAEDHQKWLDEAAKPPTDPEELGLWLYNRVGCKGCHSVDGSKIVGPSFKGSWGTTINLAVGEPPTLKFDEEYVRNSIIDPQSQKQEGYQNASAMPSYKGRLSMEEISALTKFIESLQ